MSRAIHSQRFRILCRCRKNLRRRPLERAIREQEVQDNSARPFARFCVGIDYSNSLRAQSTRFPIGFEFEHEAVCIPPVTNPLPVVFQIAQASKDASLMISPAVSLPTPAMALTLRPWYVRLSRPFRDSSWITGGTNGFMRMWRLQDTRIGRTDIFEWSSTEVSSRVVWPEANPVGKGRCARPTFRSER